MAESLHTRLLAHVDDYARSMTEDDYPALPPLAALKAAVELHTPEPDRYCGAVCSRCFNGIEEQLEYPCPTIQVIAEALGVKEIIEEEQA